MLERLPGLIAEWKLDLVVVNGENAAGGFGITETIYNELIDAGADAVTLGNHAWDQREALVFIERAPRLIRPLNYPGRHAGPRRRHDRRQERRARARHQRHGPHLHGPARRSVRGDRARARRLSARRGADAIIVDMHGEATSEKQAMGYFCDGRASLVVGTHTHVPTADHRILPGGTAFMTDVGMTGDYDSVIGMDKDEPLRRFLRKHPGAQVRAGQRARRPCAALAVETDDATGLATGSRRCGSAACWRRRGRRSGLALVSGVAFIAQPAIRCVPPIRESAAHTAARSLAIEHASKTMAGHSQFKNIMHRKGRAG